MDLPLDRQAISVISYFTGHEITALKFVTKDGLESPKFGKDFPARDVYELRDIPLKRITVIKNNILIVGLRFTYDNDESDEFKGNNGGNTNDIYGRKTHEIDVDVQEGEVLAGVTIEQDQRITKMIGFTFVKTE